MTSNSDPPDPDTGSPAAPDNPAASGLAEFEPPSLFPRRRWWGRCRDRLSLDRLGILQAIGAFVLGLVALFSSYDHITLAGATLHLQQQWGILFILASVATVFVDAELASRSRLRAADETAEERDRADQERNRAAEARKRQAEGFERLDQAALLSGRVQLDPNPPNRARFQFFLTLLAQSSRGDPES